MDEGQAREPDKGRATAYWRANVRLMRGLLAVWFAVSFGAGILFVDWLNRFMIGGYPLGFWFAQQGSIYVFILLILVYAWRMDRIDRAFEADTGSGQDDPA